LNKDTKLIDNYTGQWTGSSESGLFVLVNIGQQGSKLTGRVSIYESTELTDSGIPHWTWSFLQGEVINQNTIEGSAGSPTVHNRLGGLLSDRDLETLKEQGNIEFPDETKFKGSRNGSYKLEIEWSSLYPSGQTRKEKIALKKKRLGGSKVIHEEMDWPRFKQFALEQKDGLTYRGQARHWRLQTSFHRTGHADLIAYLDDKIPTVENHINAYSDHVYDIKNDRSLGALLNLAQHHGYPTPLLDWTNSPYVAAFFAFQNKASLKVDGSISIFIFDEPEWAKLSGRSAQLRVPNMIVRAVELPGFGNARVLPQQAMTMYSNVDDIEYILQSNEEEPGQFLRAISIPTSDREAAMRDLSLMGITWGSMFPGLDGICKQLSSRHFG